MKYPDLNYILDVIKQLENDGKTVKVNAGINKDWFSTASTLYDENSFKEGAFIMTRTDMYPKADIYADGKHYLSVSKCTKTPEWNNEVYDGTDMFQINFLL